MARVGHLNRWVALVIGAGLGLALAGPVVPVRGSSLPGPRVQTVTPQEDGALLHVVQPGESLWSIAVAYKVYIYDIQRLNEMPSADQTLFSGQKLRIPTRAPTPITPSPTILDTYAPVVNQVVSTAAARAATSTAVQGISMEVTTTLTLTPTPAAARAIPLTGRDPSRTVLTVLVILALIGIALVGFGLAVKR